MKLILLLFSASALYAQTVQGSQRISYSRLSQKAVSSYGLVAAYDLTTPGSGTTVPDLSGRGNTATMLAGHLPTWATPAMVFSGSQSLSTPTGLLGTGDQSFTLIAVLQGTALIQQMAVTIGTSSLEREARRFWG